MTRKAIDFAVIFIFTSLFCISSSYANTSWGPKIDDRELATHKGKALSVINVPGYTYIEVEGKDGSSVWIAAPSMEVKIGDRVWASKGIEMREFYSKAQGRTFPVIHFVGRCEAEGKDTKKIKKIKKPAGHPKKEISKPKTSTTPDKGSIVKHDKGYTLEELISKKDDLSGKEVTLRGKIVKTSGKIMGKRWFHLQDGTGIDGAIDLVVTSQDNADAGDIVLVTGVLGLNKDFGKGYKYDVILEGANIKVE